MPFEECDLIAFRPRLNLSSLGIHYKIESVKYICYAHFFQFHAFYSLTHLTRI